jgi:hypothetical protein
VVIMPIIDAQGVIRFTTGTPYPENPWDEIVDGLFLGGHICQQGRSVCFPTDQFDFVASLYRGRDDRTLPDLTTTAVCAHALPDGPLSARDARQLERMADQIAEVYQSGRSKRILIRCRAGINRSGLLMGLVLTRLGFTPDEAITLMRFRRSEHVLCNASFEDYLRSKS